MAKLYPPNIEGTLPGFYTTSNGATLLKIPFSMNQAVSSSEVTGFSVKIKNVTDNSLIATKQVKDLKTFDKSRFSLQGDCFLKIYVNDLVKNGDIIVGQYYKVQLAYISQETVNGAISHVIGYYSTVGIAKYTTKPLVQITGLSKVNANIHQYTYVGEYSQTKTVNKKRTFLDTTEKLYSSCFNLYDGNNNLIKTSGDILHDTSNDVERYTAKEEFTISEDLPLDKSYYLQYTVTTSNGLIVSSPRYRIQQRRRIPMVLDIDFQAELDFENGAAVLKMVSSEFQLASGNFLISRASSENEYAWENFKYFTLQSEEPDKRIFKDYTIKQGITYIYSIQQYNSRGIYSERQHSNSIMADFEDLFISDGERQLRVRYNPKMASFKNDLAEQKVETIGSKYPFIFRNGRVKYKEFSISGLISYLSDENELFISKDKLGISTNKNAILENTVTTNLVGYNIAAERTFKMEVLEWLTNGEAKIVRSPAEGNFVVRLMNVSLSPTDSLSRMLHTFTCTAYEIAPFNYENLSYYGLITIQDPTEMTMRWKTLELKEFYSQGSNDDAIINDSNIYSIFFVDCLPGTMFGIERTSNENTTWISIGVTGSYKLDFPAGISTIRIQKDSCPQGKVTLGYKGVAATNFDNITNMNNIDIICQQYIGNFVLGGTKNNLVDKLSNCKTKVLIYYYFKFIKRELRTLYIDNSDYKDYVNNGAAGTTRNLKSYLTQLTSFYKDADKKESVSKEALLNYGLEIFQIRYCTMIEDTDYPERSDKNEGYYIDRNNDKYRPSTGWFFDAENGTISNSFSYEIHFNDEMLSVEDTEEILINEDITPSHIWWGNGVICEIGYQKQSTTYSFETENSAVAEKKNSYLTQYENYLSKRDNGEYKTIKDEKDALLNVVNYYNQFIESLDKALKAYEEENGVA